MLEDASPAAAAHGYGLAKDQQLLSGSWQDCDQKINAYGLVCLKTKNRGPVAYHACRMPRLCERCWSLSPKYVAALLFDFHWLCSAGYKQKNSLSDGFSDIRFTSSVLVLVCQPFDDAGLVRAAFCTSQKLRRPGSSSSESARARAAFQ